jgi:hypothetical protein
VHTQVSLPDGERHPFAKGKRHEKPVKTDDSQPREKEQTSLINKECYDWGVRDKGQTVTAHTGLRGNDNATVRPLHSAKTPWQEWERQTQ